MVKPAEFRRVCVAPKNSRQTPFVLTHHCKHDTLLKGAFEESFPHLLQFVFGQAAGLFALQRPVQFMDKELLEMFPDTNKPGGTRYADLLAKVPLASGETQCIFVHVEIQGDHKKGFSRRMFDYFTRIYNRFGENVTAIAVFTGNKKPAGAGMYKAGLLGTNIMYKYNALHVLDHAPETLLAMKNPFALVMLAAQNALLAGKIPEVELNEKRLHIAKALIESEHYNKHQIVRFIEFLRKFVHIENAAINANFEQQIDSLTGKKHTMGLLEAIKKIEREEGIEEGMKLGVQQGIKQGFNKGAAQAKVKMVENAIIKLGLNDAQIALLANVTKGFVKKVRTSLSDQQPLNA